MKNEAKRPIHVLIIFNKLFISHEFFFKKRDVRRLNKMRVNFTKEFIKKSHISFQNLPVSQVELNRINGFIFAASILSILGEM